MRYSDLIYSRGKAKGTPSLPQPPTHFPSTIMMSHPFNGTPTLPFNVINEPSSQKSSPKSDVHAELANLPEPRRHYKWYYSTPPANDEMTDPKESLHSFLRGYFHLKSADWDGNKPHQLTSFSAPELAKLPYYYVMPLDFSMREAVSLHMSAESSSNVLAKSSRWLPDSELAVYAEEWSRNGFQGGLNWYRVGTTGIAAKDLEMFAGKKILVPSLFIGGKSDWGTYQEPGAVEGMENGKNCKDYRGTIIVDGAGHWVQQEQPEVVVKEVLKFLSGLKS